MKIRKIAALAVGAAMIGATVGFASAQPTVPQIPKSFFVNANGTPNVKIVVGSNAAAMDVASAADIAVALGSLLYTTQQVEAQNAYVKVKEEIPPATVDMWTIYAYNYTTITQDHGVTNITSWPTSYAQLPGDYWYNGAAFTATYTDWSSSSQVKTTISDKDKIGNEQLVDWHITFKNLQLVSTNPANWNQTAPPQSAQIEITPGNATIFVDYKLYNYSVTTTEQTRAANPEWGVPAAYQNVTSYYIGDAENVAANGGTIVSNYTEGVAAGESFTILGQTFDVLSVGNNTFTAGYDKGTAWYQVGQPQTIQGTNWVVTVLDISITDQRALITVKNAVTGQESNQLILQENQPVDVFGDGSVVLTLEDTFVGIDGHLIASIHATVDKKTYSTGSVLTYGGKSWEMTIHTDGTYITNVTLTNKNALEGNPLDVFGKYNLMYKFVTKANSEYYNPANGSVVQAPANKEFIVAYAYICLKEKQGQIIEKEVKVGGTLPDSSYTLEGVYANATVIKPVTEPITVMDYQVNLNDPGSNLILVGGPVANKVTQYLVQQNISKIDWYSSPGNIEYLPKALGGYDVVIVAGATRNQTMVAAKALMQYLAGL
ncbi:S-layer protein [Thermococcus sp.]|uniref:S-layer protein n=1 Tax=Thermococcus sp. TaxID=35749 RepID=UPI0025E01935|nr:S-layer protein [Thermococcus sp.]